MSYKEKCIMLCIIAVFLLIAVIIQAAFIYPKIQGLLDGVANI